MGKYIEKCPDCDGKNRRAGRIQFSPDTMCYTCGGWGRVESRELKEAMAEAISKFRREQGQ